MGLARRAIVLYVVETVLISACVIAAIYLRLGREDLASYDYAILKSLVATTVIQICFYYNDLYTFTGMSERRGLLRRLVGAFAISGILLTGLFYTVPQLQIGRGIFLINIALLLGVMFAWRRLIVFMLDRPAFRRRLLIIGAGDEAREVAEMVENHPELGLTHVGFLAPDRSIEYADIREEIVGTYDDLLQVCRTHRIAEAIVAPGEEHRHLLPVAELVAAKFEGIDVIDAQSFLEKLTGKISVHELSPTTMVFGVGFAQSKGTRLAKRVFDAVVATIGLILTGPIMLITAIVVKLDSPGPAFYSQIRVGERGKPFSIHKFRSMRTDAEKHGAVWAKQNDDRVTRVGNFIRKTRLDELPQLWNVLVGDMSLVGPRPERPVFVQQLAKEIPFYNQRHCVKPGVTGLAQVKYSYGASVEDALEKLRYDLFYMKNMSLWYDLTVILDTVKVMIFKIGSR